MGYSVKGLLFNKYCFFVSELYGPVNCDYLYNTSDVGHIYCRKSSNEKEEMNK